MKNPHCSGLVILSEQNPHLITRCEGTSDKSGGSKRFSVLDPATSGPRDWNLSCSVPSGVNLSKHELGSNSGRCAGQLQISSSQGPALCVTFVLQTRLAVKLSLQLSLLATATRNVETLGKYSAKQLNTSQSRTRSMDMMRTWWGRPCNCAHGQ